MVSHPTLSSPSLLLHHLLTAWLKTAWEEGGESNHWLWRYTKGFGSFHPSPRPSLPSPFFPDAERHTVQPLHHYIAYYISMWRPSRGSIIISKQAGGWMESGKKMRLYFSPKTTHISWKPRVNQTWTQRLTNNSCFLKILQLKSQSVKVRKFMIMRSLLIIINI